jgi:hypothetical protein
MLLVIFLLLALMALGLFGVFLLSATSMRQKKAERNAQHILDTTFDGRSDVTFKVNMASLKYETVITGAKERGYKLTHQADNQYGPHTLIFERAA